ncbi:hypothetical protein SAMN04515647_4505 [Cohaesibacter sp. ES.047]|uniref:DUF6949 family protein n=1 Tax=Cohaesibacter sp. ES.047 TaxID=1798205 RepID=UPI000BB6F7EE|nr:hypothetical protein [Cohaesibacter sp. ES.047]SNY94181.1 hypothetical protein SAMN04515647_4505 [Cohaesibacter sp. ES.047]
MGLEVFAFVYVTCVGFVCAGILSSLYQLFAQRPVGFRVEAESWGKAMIAIGMCTFAGPFIIMRNALRGRRIENRPIGWLFGSSAIAGLWSACSGVLLLNAVVGTMTAVG